METATIALSLMLLLLLLLLLLWAGATPISNARSRSSVELAGWDESKLIQQHTHTHMLQHSCRSSAQLKHAEFHKKRQQGSELCILLHA